MVPVVVTSVVCLCGLAVVVSCFRKQKIRAARREVDSVSVRGTRCVFMKGVCGVTVRMGWEMYLVYVESRH